MNVNEFLGFYFPAVNDPASKEVVAIGGDKANNTVWVARPWRPAKITLPIGRLYFCISTVNPPANARVNRVPKGAHDLVKTYVVGLDDIKDGHYADKKTGQRTRIPLPPTTVLETSAGNTQWLYRLKYGADPARAAALIEAITAAGMGDPGAKRADRYLRVPGSLNTKYDPPFVARVLEHHPERAWSLAELEVAIGVTSTEVRALNEEASPLKPGEVDPVWDRARERPGLVKGPPDKRGWAPVTCFNEAQHTPGKGATEGTDYKPSAGGGIYACQHDHCRHLTTADFRDWLFDQEVPDLGAFGADLGAALSAARAAPAEEGEERIRFRETSDHAAKLRQELLDNYVFVEAQSKYWSVKAAATVKPEALDHRWKNAMIAVGPTWRGMLEGTTPAGQPTTIAPKVWFMNQPDLRRVGNVTHRLGQTLIVDGALNIAPPVPARMDVPGDPELWLGLVDFVCGEQADLVLDWMAMTVTEMTEKPGWHIILKGPAHGTGKALMMSPLSRYLRPKLWYGLKPSDLGDKFTFFLERRLLILDELKRTTRGEITTGDIYNTIKAWTARGTDMVIIEKKGMQPYEALDLSCWAIFSNQDVPLPIEEGDRRFLVINVPEPQPDAFYGPVIKWLIDDGWKMVISWLHWRWDTMSEADRDVLRGRAPMTEAKKDLIENSGEGLEGAIRAHIRGRNCEPWPDLMTMGDITSGLIGSSNISDYYKTRVMNDQIIIRALRNSGAIQLFKGQQVKDGESKMRLWCMQGALQKGYEKLGMGKAIFEAYRSMRSPTSVVEGLNVVNFPIKR